AVDLGGFQQQVGVDLDRAQARGGVGGEDVVAGAGGENADAPLLEVAHGATPDVLLTNLVDANRGHHARVQTEGFDGVLHRERIHDGGEHAHVIAGDTIHAGTRQPGAAEDVAAADHDRDLHPQTRNVAGGVAAA